MRDPAPTKSGSGILKVDGQEVDNHKIPHTIPFLMSIDETFDVGVDTRTPVGDHDYQVPFRFTGKLTKHLQARSEQLTEADRPPRQSIRRPCQN